jgi:glycosyltransferase involved in cell wall biosynthesis
MIARRPLRVLQVLGRLNRGGAETWLLHVLRHLDRGRVRMDFLVHDAAPGDYDAEAQALGAEILVCPHARWPWAYARQFRRLLREHGPYDVVHSHVHHFSGYVLRLARRQGVPVRLAHSHLDTAGDDARASWSRRAYLALMRRWLRAHATGGLAASRVAAAALFGAGWADDPRWRLLYCGIDLAPFWQPVDTAAVRAELGLPAGAFVLGHAGRFTEQKNHRFLIEVAAETVRREPRTWLLLVGDGPLRPAVERQVKDAGLIDRVVFAGVRPDVPRLLGAADVFVMPSMYEGLPLVGLEAQAAALPCVLSDAITPEVVCLPRLVRRLSLSESPAAWAEAALQCGRDRAAVTRAEALGSLQQSPFDVRASAWALEEVYEHALL